MPGGTYEHDGLEDCPICKTKTPHRTGMIGALKACLVCGLVRSEQAEKSFGRCKDCHEWVPVRQIYTNGGEGVVAIPIPGHGCSGR